jgi:hypothetical protein
MVKQCNRDVVGQRKAPANTGNNPSWRRKGARKTRLAQAIPDKEAEALMREVIDRAKAGDGIALRLGLERLVPKRTERLIEFELPPIKKPMDAIAALSRITEGVGRGELTAGEAGTLVSLVETWLKAVQVLDFDERLTALEERADYEKPV